MFNTNFEINRIQTNKTIPLESEKVKDKSDVDLPHLTQLIEQTQPSEHQFTAQSSIINESVEKIQSYIEAKIGNIEGKEALVDANMQKVQHFLNQYKGQSDFEAKVKLFEEAVRTSTIYDSAASKFQSISHTTVFIRWENHDLQFLHIDKKISEGTYGKVYEMQNLFDHSMQDVVKIAKKEGQNAEDISETANHDIENEFELLTYLNSESIIGIQTPPKTLIQLKGDISKGYLASRYDFNLESQAFKDLEPQAKLRASVDLIRGMVYAHAKGVVHKDLKPANCCSVQGRLQVADWGGASRITEINLADPLGVSSDFYKAMEDDMENASIRFTYLLHLFANGQDLGDDFDPLDTMHNALETSGFYDPERRTPPPGLTQDEATQIAHLLASEYAEFFEENEELKASLADFVVDNPPSIETVLNTYKDSGIVESCQVQAEALCKKHDVFSMGVTLIENLSGADKRLLIDQIAKDNDMKPEEVSSLDLYNALIDAIPDAIDPQIKDYLGDIVFSRVERPSMQELLERFANY